MTSLLHLGLVRCFFTGQIPTSISSMTNLQSITLANNQLTGSFPVFMANHPSLVSIQLFGNLFDGSLPTFGYSGLAVLQLQNNLFSGELMHVFSDDFITSSLLNTLDLSENTLTGSIPPSVFNLPTLFNLALSSNCFTGSLPSTICNARHIRTISLNGLSSNNQCNDRSPLLDFLLDEYVAGQVPTCVWSLPYLRAFSVSGNRFSGKVGELVTDSALDELTLSYNHFTGTLPLSVQRQQYSLLDVSYNAFRGNFNEVSNVRQTLKTELNRFSGHLSSVFSQLKRVDMHILRGNMFSCENIPSTDENYDTYACGSSNLDNALYVASGCIFFWGIILVFICVYYYGNYSFSYTINKFIEYYFFFDAIEEINLLSPNIVKFEWMLRKAVYFICVFSVLGMMACIPIFVMKISYGSALLDNSYSWILSLAYSSGMVVSILVLLAWTCLLFVGLWCVQKEAFGQPPGELPSDKHPEKTEELINATPPSRVHVSILGVNMNMERKYYAIIILTLNGIVVLGANALYVYCVFLEFSTTTTVFVQIVFAMFTLFWKYVVMSRFTYNPTETLARRVMLKTWMDIFSAVIAPVLVLLATDPDCMRVSHA
jgi:hypothetical protein